MEIDVRTHAPADPATVYRLLADGTTWPTWSPMDSFALESEGDTGGESLNAVRVFRTGRSTSRERLVELIPDRRLSYVLLSGLPLKNYRANVDLTPANGGTDIRWHSTFKPRIFGTGWLYKLALGTFIKRCAAGLATHAAAATGAESA